MHNKNNTYPLHTGVHTQTQPIQRLFHGGGEWKWKITNWYGWMASLRSSTPGIYRTKNFFFFLQLLSTVALACSRVSILFFFSLPTIPKKLHNAISVYLRVNRIVYTHSHTRKVQTAHSCERNERRKSSECNVMEHVIVSQTPFHFFFCFVASLSSSYNVGQPNTHSQFTFQVELFALARIACTSISHFISRWSCAPRRYGNVNCGRRGRRALFLHQTSQTSISIRKKVLRRREKSLLRLFRHNNIHSISFLMSVLLLFCKDNELSAVQHTNALNSCDS